ncbi:MAG: DUF4214 domain-containing protein [Thalassovita sp.]
MTTHIFEGFAIFETFGQAVNERTLIPMELRMVMPDSSTSFSYSVTAAGAANEFPEVEIQSDHLLLAVNSVNINTLVDSYDEFGFYVGEITHGGLTTQIMSVEMNDSGRDFQLIFELGGDPLPDISTLDELDAFDGTITSAGAIAAGGPLSPNTDIAFTSLPNRTTLSDNFVNGTTGNDTLTGTSGNDVYFPGENDGFDRIDGSAGNDIYDFSDSQEGYFYEIRYENLLGPITANIGTTLSTIDKGSQGTDTWIENFRAASWNTGDGQFITGTSGNDVFNVELQTDTWFGIAAGAGNDTFNLESGDIVRIELNWDGNGNATSGANVNLVTGIISSDGFGGSDTINLNDDDIRVEIRGTDHNDTIIGSDRDERFILGQGNDTLDAGDGYDMLRYDRRDVGAVEVDLSSGTATGTWGGNAFIHHFSGVEEVRGSREDDDRLIGDSNDNRLRGDGGDDLLVGGGGDDRLQGEEGDDILFGDGFYAAYAPDTSAQVFRLYQATLGRAPDGDGHSDWMQRILTDETDLSGAAAGFVGSREFQNTYGALDDGDFVELLYQNVLGRASDAGGKQNWLDQMDGGASRAAVVTGFSESREFINNTQADANSFMASQTPAPWSDEVYRVYRATLNRDPDEGGFLDWVVSLGSGTELETVVNGFVASREFQITYGALDDGDFVELLYQNVLSRASDAGGRQDWLDRMSGGDSRESVVLGFSQSLEFINNTTESLGDWIRGLGQDDRIEGGSGENVLAGGLLSDRFVFDATDDGSHQVLDLEAWDVMEFRSFNYSNDDDVRNHMTQSGEDVVFSDQGVTVSLLDTQLSLISDDMIDW